MGTFRGELGAKLPTRGRRYARWMARLLHAVACPLHPLAPGAAFPRRAWPPHVTLLGNFVWDGGEADLIRRVAGTVDGRAPIGCGSRRLC